MMRPNKDAYYLNIATAVSERSTCLRRAYGAVIVKDDVIVSTGYNGSPRGSINCCDAGSCKRSECERYSNYEKCPSVHAEQNALISANRQDLKGATLYLSCVFRFSGNDKDGGFECEDEYPKPCPHCMKMILNSGITRVVNRKGDVEICL